MLQGGLPEKWQRMFYPPDDKCSATATGEVDQHRVVTVADMQGSFYILGFGKFKLYFNPLNIVHFLFIPLP